METGRVGSWMPIRARAVLRVGACWLGVVAGMPILLTLLLGVAPAAQDPTPRNLNNNSLDVPYGIAPVVDGLVTPGEYASARMVEFNGYGGAVVA